MFFCFLGAQQALIDDRLNRLRVNAQLSGGTARQSMEVILGGISTRSPPVFSNELIGKIPDEIDLTREAFEANLLVVILESVSKGQYHTLIWLLRMVIPEGQCMSISKWGLKTWALISPRKLGFVLMQESQVMDGVLRAHPLKSNC